MFILKYSIHLKIKKVQQRSFEFLTKLSDIFINCSSSAQIMNFIEWIVMSSKVN